MSATVVMLLRMVRELPLAPCEMGCGHKALCAEGRRQCKAFSAYASHGISAEREPGDFPTRAEFDENRHDEDCAESRRGPKPGRRGVATIDGTELHAEAVAS